MREHYREPGIQLCLMKNTILYVLVPLFLALGLLCVLLRNNLSSGTREAYQMMFSQNVRGIDNAILQSNYASSTMITYTENIRLLRQYYQADSEYEKFSVISQMEKMIANCNVTALDSFRGEMMLLMNDGRVIDSNRTADISEELATLAWWPKLQGTGSKLYWNNEIGSLLGAWNQWEYTAFGRQLMRYQGESLGYALVRIPKNHFFQFGSDPRFQLGTLAMISPDGRVLVKGGGNQSDEALLRLFERIRDGEENTGTVDGIYYMSSRLNASSNMILYAADAGKVFARSRTILLSAVFFMMISAAGLVTVVVYLSRYIADPVLFFADRSKLIEQQDPEALILKKHHYRETKALEEGMLSAQKRIGLLVEEVRREAAMKEKARYDALRAQITPHFLFNTLNAIRWKASLNNDEEVADILSDLGVLLGEAYRNTDELETIDSAMQTLDAYVKIMQIRFGDQVKFFFAVPDSLREYMIPRFCLQPLVENSFIHGMSRAKEGLIVLRGELEDGDIRFTLIDNGSGLKGKHLDLTEEQEQKKGISGIGLSNIHQRIRVLFGDQYGLFIDQEMELGFKISLKIPAIREQESRKYNGGGRT